MMSIVTNGLKVIIQALSLQHFAHLQSRLCGYNPGHSNGPLFDFLILSFTNKNSSFDMHHLTWEYGVKKSPLMWSQVRVQTTGIIEYNFPLVFRKDLTRDCIFIDVGGQRNERKKWWSFIHFIIKIDNPSIHKSCTHLSFNHV